ncbi:MAG TPA: phytanoyl-CoA dioxygenase family protein [Pyrinomonadaceae bacterium]|jgi:ectoine hydroxylase
MRLTQEQLKRYEDEGFLFLPEYLSHREIEMMKRELPSVFAEDSPRRVVEKDGRLVRSVYGSHLSNEVFQRLTRHPRLVEPAMQILKSEVYIYQFKINAKLAFDGDVWEWHQDYIFWRKEDGMPTPRVTSVVTYLDDVTEFNGPLFLIPGSHKEGVIEVSARDKSPAQDIRQHEAYRDSPNWIANLTTKLRYSLDKELVAGMIEKYGITAPKGPRGSVLFIDGNIIHGSPSNISPFDRAVVIVTFNSVENVPAAVSNPRPEFLSNRNPSPVVPLPVDTLLT